MKDATLCSIALASASLLMFFDPRDTSSLESLRSASRKTSVRVESPLAPLPTAITTELPVLPASLPGVPGELPFLGGSISDRGILPAFASNEPVLLAPRYTLTAAPAAPQQSPLLAGSNPTITALPEVAAEGYWIENAPINEIFQYLSRSSRQQYFFNNELAGPEYNVTGHLKIADAKKQMEELAVAYGLMVYEQGNTIYLMTEPQLARLPMEVMCYPLKYLRGATPGPGVSSGGAEGEGGGGDSGAGLADFEKLKSIIRPMLTREQGQIEFEEKNNVLLVTDNKVRLQKVRGLLEEIDQPKQQIVINVRILRVRKSHGSKIGVDWNSVLGDPGLSVSASQSLNALFGLPDSATLTKTLLSTKDRGTSFSQSRDIQTGIEIPTDVTTINDTLTRATSIAESSESIKNYTDSAGLVFDAMNMEAIVRALRDSDVVTQEACPTIITEDNEQGIISIVDRFPVITSNVVATTSGTNVTDEVRYKIDEEDPNASQEPQKSREIGVTLSVTPTLLPDGTVRMRLRPRVANIVDFVPGQSGNVFPRVSESTIEGISRIPKGQSLFLGGFYDSNDDYGERKIPILGSIPLVNKLFKYEEKGKEQISLVFVITPRVYDAANGDELPAVNAQVRLNSGYNRNNPLGHSTPYLPDPAPANDYLPLPMENAPGPNTDETGKKRPWFKRIFSKKPHETPPADAKPVTDRSTAHAGGAFGKAR